MTHRLAVRRWAPGHVEDRISQIIAAMPTQAAATQDLITSLATESTRIHDRECLNLNPATNVMNPAAEALLSAGLGTRASLGWVADKYETGLEAIEQIEVVAAELAARLFDAAYAEVRVGSGALANLYTFMATCRPGDTIIAPPPAIGGHVTHHAAGAAGLYGLTTVPAPVHADGYTVDVADLAVLAREVRPRLITLGGSLNLAPHPVEQVREIADEVGAKLLFDAAHLCGMVAGGQWPNPLSQGAHVLTMSTYKSLGGPPGGLLLTSDPEIAERVDAIAYPGLTANHDSGRVAALAVTLNDWLAVGADYATEMVAAAQALAAGLDRRGVPVFATEAGFTTSHQLAVIAAPYGGGQAAAAKLRRANLLACGIGLPIDAVEGDTNGLRLGTPEAVRWGMRAADMDTLAEFITRGLSGDDSVGTDVTQWRSVFNKVHFTAR
ncbi:MAG TPA: aminotransferase class I/II-fold pyridoxal phosphate-dependent enzyme [Marmoricola sp.]|nr:aminotransferase class I/II-fold pyridoxal phosphate-dependent enzyme [Marmoricola sp.]